MIPTEVILIPLFIVMAKIGWVDSYLSLIIPFSANAFGIFMMRQTMGNIPMDLLDAGANRRLHGISAIPEDCFARGKGGALCVGGAELSHIVERFLVAPLIILQDNRMFTVPLSIALMKGLDFSDYGLIMAGATVATLPVMVVFLFMSEHFISGGALSGAVKG